MGIPLVNLKENSAYSTALTLISSRIGLGTGLWPSWRKHLYHASILKSYSKKNTQTFIIGSLLVNAAGVFLKGRWSKQMLSTLTVERQVPPCNAKRQYPRSYEELKKKRWIFLVERHSELEYDNVFPPSRQHVSFNSSRSVLYEI